MGASLPFFIVGASRSGTTMLRLLLNAHRHVGVPKELAYFEQCARFGLLDSWHDPGITKEEFRHFVRSFLSKKKLALEGIDREQLEKEIVSAGPPRMDRPFRMAMDAWTLKEDKVIWGEKTPKNLFYVDIIHEMMPDARFIYILRDPRAVVYSMNRFARFEDDSVLNAFNWLQAVTTGYELLDKHIPEEMRIVLKYEELVSNVEEVSRRLCDFLGVPFDEEMLEFYRKSQNNLHPHSQELGGTNTLTKPVSTVSVDKWRDGMTSRDIAQVEAVCREPMHRFGYVCTNEKVKGLDLIKVKLKMSYCYWQQRRNKHLRAYQIAFKPFDRTRSRLRRMIST